MFLASARKTSQKTTTSKAIQFLNSFCRPGAGDLRRPKAIPKGVTRPEGRRPERERETKTI